MAKLSMKNREQRRVDLVRKMKARRDTLRDKIKNMALSEEERDAARLALQKMPRDSSPTRVRNRCRITGRSRGYYRKFGLSRSKLRKAAMRGDVPGLVKASW
ncbi:MAG: 30S ribosomal protein S14 [Gammaproteobacteria bacterium]|nr:30S ribosomal protein S14 [Gammaproteobacteria bacterium]